jgi:mannose-6-phosphate isomerase-like protein (cupin superfamily)
MSMFYKKSKDAQEFEAGDNTLLKEIAHPLGDQIPIGYSLAQARLKKGTKSLPHRLKGSELYYVLDGQARLYINDESQEMEKGDLALVPADAEQYIENIGTEDLVFLCIVEPYWRAEDEEVD